MTAPRNGSRSSAFGPRPPRLPSSRPHGLVWAFVPVVVGCSSLTLLVWLTIGYTRPDLLPVSSMEREGFTTAEITWQFAFRMALTVLAIACPCSLGLATPTAVMVGTVAHVAAPCDLPGCRAISYPLFRPCEVETEGERERESV